MIKFNLYSFLFLIFQYFNISVGFKLPNIIIMLADDMGFDDVSFHGSNEFLTPNIDALAYSGVILKNFYTPAMCTPSRAALLTGKYPIYTGMQHYVIPNYEPWSLPLNETTMAEIFQNHGYYTSILGKWHLGMSRKVYTPTFRGFDYHFGYLGAYVDYYDQTLYSPDKNYARGHDFRKNLNISHDQIGTYVTNVLTTEAINIINHHEYSEKPLFMILSHLAPHSGNEEEPLQAPLEEIKKFDYIKDNKRGIYAAMMSELDKSVGQVIDALYRIGVLSETILLFLSDNGGPTVGQHATTASNYPFRGQKNSPWEGGIRSSAALWTTSLMQPGSVSSQTIYIADLLPTLANAANIKFDTTKLDGLNLWEKLTTGEEGSIQQREIVHNIDEIFNYVSYSNGKYKFINGTTNNGIYDQWIGRRPSGDSNDIDPRAKDYENVIRNTTVWQQLQELNNRYSGYFDEVNITQLRLKAEVKCPPLEKKQPCEPLKAPCLFDIETDPCEMNNLYTEPEYAPIVEDILRRVDHHRRSAHAPNNKPEDIRCDPGLYHNEWTWWEDMQDNENVGHTLMTSVILVGISIFVAVLKFLQKSSQM